MIANRYTLQVILEQLAGTKNVYYQPPSNIKISYPAIIYSREDIVNKKADDMAYKQDTAYTVIVVDKNPDSELVYKVSQLPLCRYVRHYVADNLNHDVFKLYFQEELNYD